MPDAPGSVASGDAAVNLRFSKHAHLRMQITHILFPGDYGIDIPTFLSKAISDKQKAVEQASPAMSANGDQDEETE